MIDHFGRHLAVASLLDNLRFVVLVSDVLHTSTETEPIQIIGYLLVCINTLGSHFK
ncbi:MAG TPA: hypothetical protein VJ841_01210 [Candidatus Saccharimonadales bacterium]|nr:hypothetical protein [Candidatus Saccharimonadales bacterium]